MRVCFCVPADGRWKGKDVRFINLGKRVKELRKKKGFTQEKMAEEIGLNIRTYRGVEQGTNVGRIDTLCMIAEYFDVSVDYLLDREKSIMEMIELNYQKLPLEKRKLGLRLMLAVIHELSEE